MPDDPSSVWELHRSGQRNFNTFDSRNLSQAGATGGDEDEFVTYQVSQLTLSPENTLFHYVHLEVGEGIFLAPLKGSPGDPAAESGSLQSELLGNFRAACQIIHSTFQVALKNREMLR